MHLKPVTFVMRWRLVILAASCLCSSVSAWAQTTIEHNLSVTLVPGEHRLVAVDRVTLQGQNLSGITFELAEHCDVSGVRAAGRELAYSFNGGELYVNLPAGSGPMDLQIEYEGDFNNSVPDQPLNTDNPGYGVTGVISTRGTLLLAGARWYPVCRSGENRYVLTVTAPYGTLAVTAGKPLGHSSANGRSISRWSVEHPLQGIPLVAGPYIISTRRFGRVTAATYFSAPLQHLSDAYLDATGRYLKLYSDLFGSYAFGQFAVVENFFPTGYGFPSFTLMGRRVLELPFILHTSLGHEIAHCWWGNGVLVDPSQGNWSEGLTTYVSDYLYKEREGRGREQRLQWLRDYATLVDPGDDFPLSQFSSRIDPVTQVIGYDKGAMVFHMLRQLVGDEVFWRSLRTIYSRYRFQAINWSDFRKVFEQQSNQNLGWFFDQWVSQTGAPDFRLAQVDTTQVAGNYRISGAILQKAPFYHFSVDVLLRTGDREYTQRVTVSRQMSRFKFLSPAKPLELSVDPKVQVFRKLAPQEIPASVNALKAAETIDILVARPLGRPYLEIAQRLAVSMGLDNARIAFDDQVNPDVSEPKDRICIGLPADRRLLPSYSRDFSAQNGKFSLMGQDYETGTSSFFGVFKHPGSTTQVIALFLPASYESALSVSVKVSHYGKYSYLVFDGTRNKVKGVWPVASSMLTKKWDDVPGPQ